LNLLACREDDFVYRQSMTAERVSEVERREEQIKRLAPGTGECSMILGCKGNLEDV
jgi:hypothetical protein